MVAEDDMPFVSILNLLFRNGGFAARPPGVAWARLRTHYGQTAGSTDEFSTIGRRHLAAEPIKIGATQPVVPNAIDIVSSRSVKPAQWGGDGRGRWNSERRADLASDAITISVT